MVSSLAAVHHPTIIIMGHWVNLEVYSQSEYLLVSVSIGQELSGPFRNINVTSVTCIFVTTSVPTCCQIVAQILDVLFWLIEGAALLDGSALS